MASPELWETRTLYKMALCALFWLALGAPAYVQAAPWSPRFDITGFAVEGVPLVRGEDFSRLIAPYIGRQKTIADVEKARQLLQQAYLDLGHCSVQVTTLTSEPAAGVVTFKLLRAPGHNRQDCLPLVALDGTREADVPIAGERVAAPTASAPQPPRGAAAQFQDRTLAFAQTEMTPSAGGVVVAAAGPAAGTVPPLPTNDVTRNRTEPAPALRMAQAQSDPAPAAQVIEPAAASPTLKFDIERYQVGGNTLLKKDLIDKVLQPFVGKQKDFADVQRALEALQIAYQKEGWGTVQVTLPEQELERGEVRFEVIETRLGKIEFQAGDYFDQANLRRSLPSLVPGQTPNSRGISRSLKVANESPAKQTQVSLKAGSTDGEVDAVVKVADESPRKYSMSLDNTGTVQTGQMRLGFGFQHANLWNRDHQFTLQYVTNPEHPSKVTVLGAGYHVPLYGRGDSMDFVLGYSDVDSGTIPQVSLNVTGAGFIALARYNYHLDRIDDYEHKLIFGLDYKAFQSRVTTSSGTSLVPDITLHPVSLGYAGELRRTQDNLNFYLTFIYNPFPGGNDAAQSDFSGSPGSQFPTGARARATAEYAIWRYGAGYTRNLPKDWTLRLTGSGQTTGNALVAGEQFGVGGFSSVRGFNERAYSNDKGYLASAEVYTPDLAAKVGLSGARLKLLAFYDVGNLTRNLLQPGDQTGLSVASVGLGLRLNIREKFNLQLDYAQVLHDGGKDAGIPDGRRNSNTLHASAIVVF